MKRERRMRFMGVKTGRLGGTALVGGLWVVEQGVEVRERRVRSLRFGGWRGSGEAIWFCSTISGCSIT